MARVHHADLYGLRKAKYAQLLDSDVKATSWRELEPKAPFHLFIPRNEQLAEEYERGWKVTEVFPLHGVGMTTARDAMVIDFTDEPLLERARLFATSKDGDAELCARLGIPQKKGWNVSRARRLLAAEAHLEVFLQDVLYRPFDTRRILYHGAVVWRTVDRVMRHMLVGDNVALCIGRAGQVIGAETWAVLYCTRDMTEFNLFRRGGNMLMPLYLYSEATVGTGQRTQPSSAEWPGTSRGSVPNLAPEFVKDLGGRVGLEFVADGAGDVDARFGLEDVFHYIYAVLHSPAYRERYAEFLRADFPRIPLTSDLGLFRTLCRLGADLVALHLLESLKVSQSITSFPVRGDDTVAKGYPKYVPPSRSAAVPAALSDVAPPSRRQSRPEAGATTSPASSGRVHINREQYFDGVPPEVWQFQVGGYQVCEKWLKDRRGRKLSYDDLAHYQKVVVALKETIRLMAEVDQAVASHGGWPVR